MGVHKRVAQRAKAQHGLIRRDQLLAAGVAGRTADRWLEAGRLERVHSRVYRVAGAPHTWEQRALAAVLASGGVLSHRAAARLWRVADDADGADAPIEVTVHRPRLPRLDGAVVHRSRDLRRPHVTRRDGILVSTPMRTLADLGAVAAQAVVADALERAVVARVCSVVAVERALDDVARKGRRGAGVLRRVLDDRALGAARPDGLLEARMARILRAHGMPQPVFQHHVRVRGRLIARVDFAYPDLRIVIEVDGFEVHGSPAALQADLERQTRLVSAGWTVLRFTWLDVVRRPEWVVAQISELLRRAA